MIYVLFGSQSGTAKLYAERLVYFFRKKHRLDSQLINLKDISSPSSLLRCVRNNDKERTHVLIFIVATYGFGRPTQNAEAFHNWLKCESSRTNGGSISLDSACYAVLGLGDSCYEDFAAMGDFTDKNIGNIGGRRILELVKIDADDSPDVQENVFIKWKESLMKKIQPLGINEQTLMNVEEDTLPFSVIFENHTNQYPLQSVENAFLFDAKQSPVVRYRYLCPNAIELVFSTKGLDSRGNYLPGSTANVSPLNNLEVVSKVAENLGLHLEQRFSFEKNKAFLREEPPFPTPCTIRTALLKYCDLNARPHAEFLEELSYYCKGFDGGSSEFTTVGEALFSAHEPRFHNLSTFFYLVPKIVPRSYTIASSPLANPNEVCLCVKLVRDIKVSSEGKPVHGLASGYFESVCTDFESGKSVGIDVSIAPSAFGNLAAELEEGPIVMVAAGTGIAPMRGIIEHRKLLEITRFVRKCAAYLRFPYKLIRFCLVFQQSQNYDISWISQQRVLSLQGRVCRTSTGRTKHYSVHSIFEISSRC
mmetsp:Transcript_12898/g.16030  ORF Transcript_12898/g.16030 Transcript_12898/m.16030 type:complete len:533 (-) Transcript_12898:1723-3321(-)